MEGENVGGRGDRRRRSLREPSQRHNRFLSQGYRYGWLEEVRMDGWMFLGEEWGEGGLRTYTCEHDDVTRAPFTHGRESGLYDVDGPEEVGFELGAD